MSRLPPRQRADAAPGIDADALWDMVCGPASLLAFFARTPGLHELVGDLAIETIESERFDAAAVPDPEDPSRPLLRFSTACFDQLLECHRRAFRLAEQLGICPWKALGWRRAAFSDGQSFAAYVTRVAIDFMVVHEVSHVARGHVERYLTLGPNGMAESGGNAPAALGPLRRLTLELDADNVALYHLITLAELLRGPDGPYRTMPNTTVFVSTLGFAMRILFALLNRLDGRRSRRTRDERSLLELHRGSTHPLPAVRDEFADQRVLQLALDATERRRFRGALARSQALHSALVDQSLWAAPADGCQQRDAAEVADFLNLLIDDLAAAAREGWMDGSTRIARALREAGRSTGRKEEFS